MNPVVSKPFEDDKFQVGIKIAQLLSSRNKLNQAIQNYASRVWQVDVKKESDQFFFASFLYNADFAKLKDENDPGVLLALKVRECLENYMNVFSESEANLLTHLSDSIEIRKKISSLYSLAKAVDDSTEDAQIFLWGSSEVTAHLPSIHASENLSLASATVGILKTLKDGIKYLYVKNKAKRISKKIQKNLTSITDNRLQETDRKRDLRILQRNLAKCETKMVSLRHHAGQEIALNSTFFSGSILPAVATTTAATIASATLGGIAYGAVLTVTSTESFNENRTRSKLLDEEDFQLRDKELALPESSVTRQIVRLRRDNIQGYQRKQLWLEHLKNGLLGASGLMSVVTGILAIIVAAGVVISAIAIAATGIGLGVLTLFAALAYVGHILYKYYENNTSTIAEIRYQQLVLLSVQQIHSNYKAKLTIIPESEDRLPLLNLLALQSKLEGEKRKLQQLTRHYHLERQASQEFKPLVKAMFEKIDQQSEDDLLLLKHFFEQDLKIDMREMEIIDSIEEKRAFMKSKIADFIARTP